MLLFIIHDSKYYEKWLIKKQIIMVIMIIVLDFYY